MYIIQGSRETRLHKYRPMYLTPELAHLYLPYKKKEVRKYVRIFCGALFPVAVEFHTSLLHFWNWSGVCY